MSSSQNNNQLNFDTMDTALTDNGGASDKTGQVQVYFVTDSPDIELPEGKRQLLVPTSKALSMNNILVRS